MIPPQTACCWSWNMWMGAAWNSPTMLLPKLGRPCQRVLCIATSGNCARCPSTLLPPVLCIPHLPTHNQPFQTQIVTLSALLTWHSLLTCGPANMQVVLVHLIHYKTSCFLRLRLRRVHTSRLSPANQLDVRLWCRGWTTCTTIRHCMET